jgi:hypothetical protein
MSYSEVLVQETINLLHQINMDQVSLQIQADIDLMIDRMIDQSNNVDSGELPYKKNKKTPINIGNGFVSIEGCGGCSLSIT